MGLDFFKLELVPVAGFGFIFCRAVFDSPDDFVADRVSIIILACAAGGVGLIPNCGRSASLVDVGLLDEVDDLAVVFDDGARITSVDASGGVRVFLAVLKFHGLWGWFRLRAASCNWGDNTHGCVSVARFIYAWLRIFSRGEKTANSGGWDLVGCAHVRAALAILGIRGGRSWEWIGDFNGG